MLVTFTTILVLNAGSKNGSPYPVFWVAMPAAFLMLCNDLASDWCHRHEIREISRQGWQEVERARAEQIMQKQLVGAQVTPLGAKSGAAMQANASVGSLRITEAAGGQRRKCRCTKGCENEDVSILVGGDVPIGRAGLPKSLHYPESLGVPLNLYLSLMQEYSTSAWSIPTLLPAVAQERIGSVGELDCDMCRMAKAGCDRVSIAEDPLSLTCEPTHKANNGDPMRQQKT